MALPSPNYLILLSRSSYLYLPEPYTAFGPRRPPRVLPAVFGRDLSPAFVPPPPDEFMSADDELVSRVLLITTPSLLELTFTLLAF